MTTKELQEYVLDHGAYSIFDESEDKRVDLFVHKISVEFDGDTWCVNYLWSYHRNNMGVEIVNSFNFDATKSEILLWHELSEDVQQKIMSIISSKQAA